VLNDLRYRDDFEPAAGARIVAANCTNWNLVMFNRCHVRFAEFGETRASDLTFWRFGRAPGGRVRLLERHGTPHLFSTDVALATLSNRLAFVCAVIGAGAFFTLGLVLHAVRRIRQ
jgi:hypothetical protein